MGASEYPPCAATEPTPPSALPLRPPRPVRPHRPEDGDSGLGDRGPIDLSRINSRPIGSSPREIDPRSSAAAPIRADAERSRGDGTRDEPREGLAQPRPPHGGTDDLGTTPAELERSDLDASPFGPVPPVGDAAPAAAGASPLRRLAVRIVLAAGSSLAVQISIKLILFGTSSPWARWLGTWADHPLRCALALLALSLAAYPLRSAPPCRLAAGDDCA